MSWRNTIITGVVIGSVLGFASYTALSHIGAEIMLESVTTHACGLKPDSACVALDNIVPSSIVATDNNAGMQPFAPAQEDELTARQRLQDTSSPQVTQHGYFIQATANSGRLQGTTAVSGSW